MPNAKNSIGRVRRPKRIRPQVQAQHVDYALHTLGWASFQDLCASVFEVVFDRTVSVYSKTHDGGRDGSFKGLITRPKSSKNSCDCTLQTKHVSRADVSLTLAGLAAELKKIKALVKQGRATGYVLMTNAIVTATEAEKIERAIIKEGVQEAWVFGRDWINKKIHEHPKIRATVPRLYGLGDLSWIVDERAVAQALEILGSLGNDMRCYVRTKAHLKAVDALLKHGFVLLIGEPAAGKSTIAANLAMAAIDINSCDVIRVTGPSDIVNHWNPREKNRFFWVDDAFGSTQYNRDSADLWNKVLPTMSAALRCGNRFVLTSRDYIWRQARQDLKSESFKPLIEGRVVIYAEDLTKEEKERILYNHIKFGDQPQPRRRWMKPHLQDIAQLSNFKPEIARRLGNTFFTKDIEWSSDGLEKFVDSPRRFLADVIRQLDASSRAAVALIFLNGGRVASPVTEDDSVRIIETTLGVSCHSIRSAMEHLNNTLVLHVVESGQTYWMYKHPTIADAYAELISEQPELVEIYLRGAKIGSILNEVVYGTKTFQGAKLRVPKKLFDLLAARIRETSARNARLFLLTRADAEFRRRYTQINPNVLSDGIGFGNPLLSDPQSQFFITAGREGLLTESDYDTLVRQLHHELTNYGDATFLTDERFIAVLGKERYNELLRAARDELAPQFADIISNIADDCDTDDPESYFEETIEALSALETLFPDDEDTNSYIQAAHSLIEETIDEVKEKSTSESEDDHSMYEDERGSGYQVTSRTVRENWDEKGDGDEEGEEPLSVFDDIDE